MAASAEQIARMKAGRFIREYKVYVGPPRSYVTLGLFSAGEAVTLPSSTVTTAGITPASTTIAVSSTAGYPTTGTILVGGAGWFAYTGKTSNSFTGATYLHGTGTQASGASVTAWADITDRVTALSLTETERLPVYDWAAELAGVRYSSDLLKPDASVLLLQRLAPEGDLDTFTDWLVMAVGYVRQWQSQGDANGNRPWTCRVESIGTYVRSHRTTARRFGRVNLASGASISDGYSDGTSPAHLSSPALEPKEFAGGVLTASVANLSDGNPDTRYVSSLIPTRDPETPGSGSAVLIIEEVMVEGPDGAPADLQYIVIRLPSYSDYYNEEGGLNVKNYILTTTATQYIASTEPGWPPNASDYYIRLPDVALTPEQPTLILCGNRETFQRYFNVSGGAPIYDWRFLPPIHDRPADGTPPARLLTLDPDGDVIHIRNHASGVEPDIVDMVAWGTTSDFYESQDDNTQWNDPTTVTLGDPGTSIRRVPVQTDTNAAADWDIEETPAPGDPRTTGDDIWFDVDLGQFDVTLQETMTNVSPGAGAWLTLSDATPLPASGAIVIGSERISYSERDDNEIKISARGAGGTTAAAHAIDAAVSLYDATLGAHRLYEVESVELRRQRVLDDNNLPVVPRVVEVWGTTMESPRFPGTASYPQDWMPAPNGRAIALHINESRALSFRIPLQSDPTRRTPRLRHVMVRIREMSDGGRAKLNELYVWRRQPASLTTTSDELGAGAIAYELLTEVLDPTEITIDETAFVGTVIDRTIAEGRLEEVLTDLLSEAMATIRYTLDGRVEIKRHPAHPLGPRPEIMATLDALSVRSPHEAERPSRLGLGQLIVEIVDARTDEHYIGRYPPQAAAGEVERRALRLGAGSDDGAAMIAQALYLDDERISARFHVVTSGPAEWLHAGDRVLFADYSDADSVARLYDCRVTEVTHGGPEKVETVTLKEWRKP